MLYLGIDQHRKQLTVNLRDEMGEIVLQRQVSTQWGRVRAFFEDVRERASADGGFMTIVEVCGFNDWLLKMLDEFACCEIVVIQPEARSRQKTDRRDANQLAEILWVNRQRLRDGRKVNGLRRVLPPSREDAADRQLTSLRQKLTQGRTKTINKVQRLLLKHNLQQECPTKGFHTKKARQWLRELPLDEMDRFELNLLLVQWSMWDEQLESVDRRIVLRQQDRQAAVAIATIPGAGAFNSLTLASRIGPIERFANADSLANYWGLTPGCRNSGDATDRLGSITKQGSFLARYVLGMMVMHVLRKDPYLRNWYRNIKKRRGSKIARVAVMRRLATIIWKMVKRNESYVPGGPNQVAFVRKRTTELAMAP